LEDAAGAMAKYRRKHNCGGYYFFTVVTFKRQPILTTELGRQCLRQVWKTVADRHPFETFAICLMPNHIHCIWKMPEGDHDFSTRWRLIKTGFSRLWVSLGGRQGIRNGSRIQKSELAIWQRRFWEHRIRDDDDLKRHLDYIHYNPMKHKFVEKAADWPWSSYWRYAQKGKYDIDTAKENLDWMDNLSKLAE
jgi:putative transposase